MKLLLDNAVANRRLPDWRAVQIAARVPVHVLRQARDALTNTPDELYYQMLDSIGIDAICDIVSQGCFVYDVAVTLDIPVTKFRDWLEAEDSRLDKLERAEEMSAEAYLSMSNEIVMSVKDGDTDSAKVAKLKADHLKWLASARDKERYGKHVNHKHSGGQTVEYRITLAPPPKEEGHTIIDVPNSTALDG